MAGLSLLDTVRSHNLRHRSSIFSLLPKHAQHARPRGRCPGDDHRFTYDDACCIHCHTGDMALGEMGTWIQNVVARWSNQKARRAQRSRRWDQILGMEWPSHVRDYFMQVRSSQRTWIEVDEDICVSFDATHPSSSGLTRLISTDMPTSKVSIISRKVGGFLNF